MPYASNFFAFAKCCSPADRWRCSASGAVLSGRYTTNGCFVGTAVVVILADHDALLVVAATNGRQDARRSLTVLSFEWSRKSGIRGYGTAVMTVSHTRVRCFRLFAYDSEHAILKTLSARRSRSMLAPPPRTSCCFCSRRIMDVRSRNCYSWISDLSHTSGLPRATNPSNGIYQLASDQAASTSAMPSPSPFVPTPDACGPSVPRTSTPSIHRSGIQRALAATARHAI
jgi:hypothetical protein